MFVTLSVDPAIVVNLARVTGWMYFDAGIDEDGPYPDCLQVYVEGMQTPVCFHGSDNALAVLETLEIAATAHEDDQQDRTAAMQGIAAQLHQLREDHKIDAEMLRRSISAATSIFIH